MTTYRNATLDEISEVLGWAAQEGWNPGLEDAEAFFAADPKGFFVAFEADRPVAGVSVVNHNANFAFLGLYIVLPSYRGQGIGYGLWKYAVGHAGNRIIGLDGVPEQQSNYAASGFSLTGGTVRYTGTVPANHSSSIRDAAPEDINGLIEREASLSNVQKETYLEAWFTNTETRRTLLDPNGFCTVRKCQKGAKIGPLIAADQATARRLVEHAASIFGQFITIDVPGANNPLVAVCRDFLLQPGFETARMYRGGTIQQGEGCYAVTTLELG